MAKPAPDAPADKVALYDKLVDHVPGVQRKGAKNPYTSMNGHMFSFMTPTGQLALRMSKDDREEFKRKYKTDAPIVYNTVMKEYVLVPDSMLARTTTVKKFFLMSIDYVGSLKPKPTTKSKKAAAKKQSGTKKKATSPRKHR